MSLPQPPHSPTSSTLSRLAAGCVSLASAVGRAILSLGLILLYYGVFTPVGFLLRLFGRDELEMRHHANRTTYWKPKSADDGLQVERARS